MTRITAEAFRDENPLDASHGRQVPEFEKNRAADRYRTLARLVRGYVFEGTLLPTGSIEFTWADDEFGEIFGCERQEVNARGWHSFVDARDRQGAQERLASLGLGETVEIELRIVSATGKKRWLRMAAEPLPGPEKERFVIIGMAEDITNRKALMEHMFDVIHKEQRRIGSELHDGLGQVLTGVSLLMRSYHTHLSRGEAVTPGAVEHVIGLVAGAIETTRRLAHGLAPGKSEFGGLTFTLGAYLRQSRSDGLNIELFAPEDCNTALNLEVSDHLYRIVQEAVANIALHAHAARAQVEFSISDSALVIEVRDDGIGVANGSQPGFGLQSMRYRADAIGAHLSIGANKPRGTKVRVQLPIDGFKANGGMS